LLLLKILEKDRFSAIFAQAAIVHNLSITIDLPKILKKKYILANRLPSKAWKDAVIISIDNRLIKIVNNLYFPFG
jgi:hypothetical protein